MPSLLFDWYRDCSETKAQCIINKNTDTPQKKCERARSVGSRLCTLSSFAQLPAVYYQVFYLNGAGYIQTQKCFVQVAFL